ncbi:G-alpha-domain-containing protein [Punctularia strigosozonata HHB-11173 SS5]|uniref:G-alpha-domain-containing protein n=1 Tax=Punctularia strigosozonata (strain HHB-11173) TaxID=741275 RepID=UPI0004418200|nr:G-alpha-domain-containing protein [Punctularia strigosozonata HHB-11173 SS5]EIN08754.1 G-alpha-domain-containing protein [Punctularia strigosozonata HHB-11173 SS5]
MIRRTSLAGSPPDIDPLALAWGPPPDEDAPAKAARLSEEAEAKKVSDEIDARLKEERNALKKRRKGLVKVLLLGQAESGKSTTLKNFQMIYAPAAWRAQRRNWRAVVQLNLIRSINAILDVLAEEADLAEAPSPVSPSGRAPYGGGIGRTTSLSGSQLVKPVLDTSRSAASMRSMSSTSSHGHSPTLSQKHQLLRIRLAPLRRVESDLKQVLSIGDDSGGQSPLFPTPFDADAASARRRPQEVMVRSWQYALGATRGTAQTHGSGSRRRSLTVSSWPADGTDGGTELRRQKTGDSARMGQPNRGKHEGKGRGKDARNDEDDATEVLAVLRDDMKALWEDEIVQAVLRQRRVRPQERAGFFLDDLDRIAQRDYEPSDDDVLRARLRTTGVQEHRLAFEEGGFLASSIAPEWVIYDVGGCRTSRQTWLPYFEDLNAIIFLAPISCFDEWLAEDPRVNRLEDSFVLWKSICSTKLLQNVQLILFMNKVDLLTKKLQAGVEVNKYLPSFADRPLQTTAVVKYLRNKFRDILHQRSPSAREFYGYPTSVIDTKATKDTIKSIRDGILLKQLRSTSLLD